MSCEPFCLANQYIPITPVDVADGAKDTPPKRSRVCLLTLCSDKSAVPRAQRVWDGEKGRAGKVVSAAVGPVGMDINTAFTQIAAQNWGFSEKALQMHTNIEAWETWTAEDNPWIKSQGCAGGKSVESTNWYENLASDCVRVRIRAKRLELLVPSCRQ